MNTKKIDAVNIGLIVLSLLLAYYLPFELFLFSYAVLGPLHYLTELNWLNEKKFFINKKSLSWLFVVLSLVSAAPFTLQLPLFTAINQLPQFRDYAEFATLYYNDVLLFAFLIAIAATHFEGWIRIAMFLSAAIAAQWFFSAYMPFSMTMIGVFLPTIVHVYVFTLFFMLHGAFQSKSNIGLIGVGILSLIPFAIAFSNVDPIDYVANEFIMKNLASSGIHGVSTHLGNLFDTAIDNKFYLYTAGNIKIYVFIAFAYTYHYLNWFSKISVIAWAKNISKLKLSALLLIWIMSILLYWRDYAMGLSALLMLSFLHVFLEFPLNIISMKGICKNLHNRISKKAL